jgi:hypothetical protein
MIKARLSIGNQIAEAEKAGSSQCREPAYSALEMIGQLPRYVRKMTVVGSFEGIEYVHRHATTMFWDGKRRAIVLHVYLIRQFSTRTNSFERSASPHSHVVYIVIWI